MGGREDPLGTLLARAGVISAADVADIVSLQRQAWPIASLAYVLGLADEQTLVAALSLQLGVPGVVLDRSTIVVDVMEGIAPELALEHHILPLAEERHRLLVACEHPHAVREVLRELEFIKGKSVVPHIALKLTLERTLRACLRARGRGQRLVTGPLAPPGARGAESIVVVGDPARAPGRPSSPPTSSATSLARAALIEDVTREVPFEEVVRAVTEDAAQTPGWLDPSGTDPNLDLVLGRLESRAPSAIIVDTESGSLPLVSPDTAVAQILARAGSAPIELIDLDDSDGVEYRPVRGSPGRVLVVDDDFASRQFLVKELVPLGIDVQTAEHGGEAISLLTEAPPDVLVADVMLPGISGLHICRAVKHSRKYSRIGVVLFSAVIESGRVTDELVRRHGADAYFEKPLQMDRFKARLGELLLARGAGADDGPDGQASFEHALSLYRAGELDAAMTELRRGIEQDPMSAKHHFVLANLLHKKELIALAIDEYEATLELKPDYFPALTRLAYLYYQQGYAARAIDTWRRALPLCSDPGLRRNIEVFMRKLIGDLDRR